MVLYVMCTVGCACVHDQVCNDSSLPEPPFIYVYIVLLFDLEFPTLQYSTILYVCTLTPGLSDTGLSDTGLSDTGLSNTGWSNTGLSEIGLSEDFIYPTLHCESPSLLFVQFTMIYPKPGSSNTFYEEQTWSDKRGPTVTPL